MKLQKYKMPSRGLKPHDSSEQNWKTANQDNFQLSVSACIRFSVIQGPSIAPSTQTGFLGDQAAFRERL